MSTEIERKFLVIANQWQAFRKDATRSSTPGTVYRQGYIAADARRTVRVRIAGEQSFLTIKGATIGIARSEYEYPIPVEDAREMLQTLCVPPWIEKTRYTVEWEGFVWEVDEFDGENRGLILAEVELTDSEQAIDLPTWIGEEVSHDPRYYNSNLAKHPFSQW
ncbi:MAG: CYTH domain-containing protein [Leptolyngbyaceae cyanobacterium RU_5_1]|nr:CYTH domain-containing protein [Leptolyngbyaceae cyanobacterium RU_5_1]